MSTYTIHLTTLQAIVLKSMADTRYRQNRHCADVSDNPAAQAEWMRLALRAREIAELVADVTGLQMESCRYDFLTDTSSDPILPARRAAA